MLPTRLVLILAGSLLYGTVTFENSFGVYFFALTTTNTKFSTILLYCMLEYIPLRFLPCLDLGSMIWLPTINN